MSGGRETHDAELKHIEQVSRGARTTWFGLLGVLVFGAIAVGGVADRDFFTYGAGTALPLVGVTVPTVGFFYAAPILILAIYIHLHLYLLKLWRGLGVLPAHIHVEGSVENVPLDDVVYPWLLSDAAIQTMPEARRRSLGWLTRLVSLVLGWWAGPLVLGLFWVRSWPYHDPVLTLYLAGLTLAAIWIGTFSYFRARREMRGARRTWRIVLGWLCGALIVLSTAVALPFYSWMKTAGNLPGQEFVPVWRANLYQAAVVARPGDWSLRGEAEEVFLARYGSVSRPTLDALLAAERNGTGPPEGESLEWLDAARRAFGKQRDNLLRSFDKLDLAGRDLRRADLRDAFLPGIRLPGARLGGADMSGAQMEGVVFSEQVGGEWNAADLAGAPCNPRLWQRIPPRPPELPPGRAALGCTSLANAHLEGAQLHRADLSGADLRHADLSGADLGQANLSGADLSRANLSGADLGQANLAGARLAEVNLSGARLRRADLSGAFLRWANFSGADLRRADLSGAKLRWANLSGADLTGADLSGANLRQANLGGAYLGGLLSADELQLEGAIGDDQTHLPPRGPTPHVIATCYDALTELSIKLLAKSWRMDEAAFRARYVCPEGTPPGRIVGPVGR